MWELPFGTLRQGLDFLGTGSKGTGMKFLTGVFLLTLDIFCSFSGVTVVDFEQVNTCWVGFFGSSRQDMF